MNGSVFMKSLTGLKQTEHAFDRLPPEYKLIAGIVICAFRDLNSHNERTRRSAERFLSNPPDYYPETLREEIIKEYNERRNKKHGII